MKVVLANYKLTENFSDRDDQSLCLRHGFNLFERTQVFSWCRRYDCPDAVRLRSVDAPNPFGDVDVLAPRCIVDKFMLRLVSCVLRHIFNMRRVMEDEEDDFGLEALSCERFLGVGWQATFLKKFCTKVDHGNAGNADRDLIALEEENVNLMTRPDPLYRQAHASDVFLIPQNPDLNLTHVLPVETEFRMSDVSHTM